MKTFSDPHTFIADTDPAIFGKVDPDPAYGDCLTRIDPYVAINSLKALSLRRPIKS